LKGNFTRPWTPAIAYRKETKMLRIKTLFAGFALTVIIGLVNAQAQTVKVQFAGSSALWQTLALGTYNGGKGPTGGGGTAPFFHYTGSSKFNVTDSRPTTPIVDSGNIWIVWDSASTPNVWAYVSTDSTIGVRCYFANPACAVGVSAFPSVGNIISSLLWGDNSSDSTPPTSVQALFTGAGVKVNVAATTYRAEDALFATCRANSQLGNGTPGSGDGLDGLGYNTVNPPGTCPQFGASQAALVGSGIQSGYPGSTSKANLLAFSLTGKDPFTGATVPKYTTVSVGASPIAFIIERNGGQLAGLKDATDAQLQQVFSGKLCDASAFGLPAAGIQAYLYEPQSGTGNVAEATVFRRPTVPASQGVLGISQETGVNAANPLTKTAVACPDSAGDGKGGRWRAIAASEEVKSVLNSVKNNGTDGIGFTFFSYGNVSTIADSTGYGYITLDGTDPFFASYSNGTTAYDPGQPLSPGVLPSATDLPAACSGNFPCPETDIWKGGLSFPNLRSGAYRSWNVLRIISTGTALTNAEKVIASSQAFVVTSVPDYVPATSTKVTINSKAFTDPGLTLIRSHYQQTDGNGNKLGGAPVNSGTTEAGGDIGGAIITPANTGTQLIQDEPNANIGR
jgi:hypothetical protein